MTTPTLYRIVDAFAYLDREDEYNALTLAEAARRMDDLTGCGEAVILSDWDEPCEVCHGSGRKLTKTIHPEGGFPRAIHAPCDACGGDCKWPGPWGWSDPETGREVTMRREVS